MSKKSRHIKKNSVFYSFNAYPLGRQFNCRPNKVLSHDFVKNLTAAAPVNAKHKRGQDE
jgi:hypothetical protein